MGADSSDLSQQRLYTTALQVVQTSVTVSNNSPIQDYLHPDDHTHPT